MTNKSLSPLGLGATSQELPNGVQLVPTAASIDPTVPGLSVDALGNVYSGTVLQTQKTNSPEIALAAYRAIPNSTARKIAWVGDSTTGNLFAVSLGGFATTLGGAVGTDYTASLLSAPGQPYYNVTHGNFGSNGNSLANWLAVTSLVDITAIKAFNPDLIVFGYGGINDVRLGATSQVQLQALMIAAVNLLQSNFPGKPIVLRGANPLVYDSANAFAYIDAPVSLAKVQSYSDIMRVTTRNLIGMFAGVYVLDVTGGDSQIFTQNCTVLSAKGTLMADALHPSGEGFAAIIREVGISLGNYNYIRFPSAFLNTLPLTPKFPALEAFQATSISPTTDYLLCPRVLEDPTKYNLIANGLFIAGAAGSYLDFGLNNGFNANLIQGVLQATDICIQYGVAGSTIGSQGDTVDNGNAAFLMSGTSKSALGGNIRFLGFGAGYPRAQNIFQNLRIYRARPATQKNPADPNIAIAIASTTLTGVSVSQTVQCAGVIAVMSCIAATAVTSGTVTVAVNGVTVATLTFTSSVNAVGSGTFFTAATAGLFLNEGDVVTCTFTLTGGSLPVVRLSNS